MNIELKKLELMNFKGIKEKTIDFGKETYIFGMNETGKTTIFDSFTWLLFGKDSANRSDFNVKTLDSNGEVIHGLEHQVTGTLVAGGKEVILRRLLKENWVKKRGSADSVFSGNTTDYFINEEPKKEKDYKDFINSIIDENVFKLLTNPMHFNVNTSWQDRRKILLSIVGDISDEEVIGMASKDLSKLAELLKVNTIDSLKAIIASKKKKLNEQLKAIPIRIDEINRNLPVLADGVDYTALEKERTKIKGELAYLENQLSNQQRIAEEFIKKQSELSSKKNRLKDLEIQIEKDSMKNLNSWKMNLMQLNYNKENLEKKNESDKEVIVRNQNEINSLQAEMQVYRDDYTKVFNEPFEEPDRDNFVCPTCKQSLPVDDVERQIAGLLANYKSNKLKKLEEITNQGKWRKSKVNQLQSENDKLNNIIIENELKLMQLSKEINDTQMTINVEESKEHSVDYNSNAEYRALSEEIKSIEKNLLPLEQNSRVKENRDRLQDRLQEINTVLANKQVIEDSNARIAELKKEERTFSQQVAELEGQEFLTEEFIKAKVNLLEKRINDTFKYVTFKMFDVQVNGGLNETCQAMVNGIPYQDVNNAGKINAGLDIIEAMSKYYDTYCPVFIDNAESVNELITITGQLIRLVVTEDKELKIERG